MHDFTQQIEAIEKEIRETPYHKGTEHHIGKLRARLARLKDKQIESGLKAKGGGGGGGGYAVKKQGDATVVLIGPPSAGKSTLINQITNAESKVAAYAFTTTSVIPGMLLYRDAYIQIMDIPGLIEGASAGKGRGKEVLSVARNSDLLVIMTDVERVGLLGKLQEELEEAGIRINQQRPLIKIDKKIDGGLSINSNIKQNLSKELIKDVATEFGIKNAEIALKEKLSLDRLIDAFSSNRVYIPAIFVVNKIDKTKNIKAPEDVLRISAEKGIGVEKFKETLWEALGLVKIYLVEPFEDPNQNHPLIVRNGNTLKEVTEKLGTTIMTEKKLAKIWGPTAYFPGQEVPLTHEVAEGLMVRFV
jgi:small GTP-binding protein